MSKLTNVRDQGAEGTIVLATTLLRAVRGVGKKGTARGGAAKPSKSLGTIRFLDDARGVTDGND